MKVETFVLITREIFCYQLKQKQAGLRCCCAKNLIIYLCKHMSSLNDSFANVEATLK